MFRHLYKLRTGFRGQSRGEGGQEQEWNGGLPPATTALPSSLLLRSQLQLPPAAAPSSCSWDLTSAPHVHSALNSMCRGSRSALVPSPLNIPWSLQDPAVDSVQHQDTICSVTGLWRQRCHRAHPWSFVSSNVELGMWSPHNAHLLLAAGLSFLIFN